MFFNFKNARFPNGVHANQAQRQDYFTIFSNMLKTQPISIAVIENESSVRKRPARKMAITDKMVKNSVCP